MSIKTFVKSKLSQWLTNPEPKSVVKNGLLDDRYNNYYDPLVGDRYATVELGNFLALYSSHPWVYVCAAAISGAAASVPYQLKIDGVEVENADEHADFLSAPNPNTTWFDLIEITFLHLELAGNAYWEIVHDKDNKVIGIFPLRPDRVKIVPDAKKKIAGYIYNVGHGTIIEYKPDEVIHLKYNDAKNEFYGIPPVSAAKNDITLDFNATTWNKNFFENGAEPGSVLQTDKSLTNTAYERLRQTWYKRHKGVDKAHDIAILEEGLKFTQVTSKHIDMQFFELKNWNRDTIMACMRVPPVVVGITQKLSTGTERDQKKTFWYDNVIPKLLRLQHVINHYLMEEHLEFVFIVKAIDSIIEDDAVKSTIVQSNVAHGIMTINEAREKYYAMPPIGWGDTWWRPIGLVDVQNPVPVVSPDGTNTDAEPITSGARAGLNSPSQVPQVDMKPDKAKPQTNLYPTKPTKKRAGKKGGRKTTGKKPNLKIPPTFPNVVNMKPSQVPHITTPDSVFPVDLIDIIDGGFGKSIEIEKIERDEPNWDDPRSVADYKEWAIWKATAGPDDRKIRKLFKEFFVEQGERVKAVVEKGWPIQKAEEEEEETEASDNAARDLLILAFLFDLGKENDLLMTAYAPLAKNMVSKYGNILMTQLNADLKFDLKNETVLAFLKEHAADNVSKINETTRALLKNQLTEAYDKNEGIKDILTRIDQVFLGDVSVWRANKIAKTELGVLTNNGRYMAAVQSGVAKKKRWICALLSTSRERAGGENHVDMHDKQIDMDAYFEAPKRGGGFDKMLHPGDTNAHAENIVHCFCYASYSAGTPEFEDVT